MRTLLALLIAALTVSAQAPTKQVPAQGPPPRNLTVRADGHVSANRDPADADKFEVHVVKQGETLSQIAGEVLKNPRLWPQLWEQNEHIINPHWIYPDDKILIRPIVPLAEAKPPETVTPAAPAPPAATPEPPAETPPAAVSRPAPAAAPAPRPSIVVSDAVKPAPEVKYQDLYCSGFVSKAGVPHDLKVIGKYDATGAVLASEADYVYVSHGSEDGIATGNTYDVVRPTKSLINPDGRTAVSRDLGMHYLDVAQVRVVLSQPEFSLARVIHSCGDAIEVGDILVPFVPVAFPQPPRPRPFSPTMTVNSGVQGIIVGAKSSLMNFGSTFKLPDEIPGVHTGGVIGAVEHGIAEAGSIVYIDIGQDAGVQPGDVFIVFRRVELDRSLFPPPLEAERLRNSRTAIGELIVTRVGERASTALVSYGTDALMMGDMIERR